MITIGKLSSPLNYPSFPVNSGLRSDEGLARLGKVAIIRDMAAVTYVKPAVHRSPRLTYCSLEAMIYFLYTSKITFAPLSSDIRYEVLPEDRVGDWNLAKTPCPSAKSIYRLADKVSNPSRARPLLAHRRQYDIPALKEQAKEHIHDSLIYCDIVDEVFSSFSIS